MPATATTDPTPRHGDRGTAASTGPRFPRTLTIAISRQSGARGGSIAKRVGRLLGWQYVDQDLMEFIAQQGVAAGDELSAAASAWADKRLDELRVAGNLGTDPQATHFARVILTLGATGEVVLLGRGSGHILPTASTLHVRVIAPRADRIAYFSQWQRLTPAEAEREVDTRDQKRAQYLLDQFGVDAADPVHYHFVLNSSLLGVEMCADLIAQAARARLMSEESTPADEPALG
jgi:hypothetical protein